MHYTLVLKIPSVKVITLLGSRCLINFHENMCGPALSSSLINSLCSITYIGSEEFNESSSRDWSPKFETATGLNIIIGIVQKV